MKRQFVADYEPVAREGPLPPFNSRTQLKALISETIRRRKAHLWTEKGTPLDAGDNRRWGGPDRLERRGATEAALLRDPERSDSSIARETGASRTTVRNIRRELVGRPAA
jgi:hypothetical protein